MGEVARHKKRLRAFLLNEANTRWSAIAAKFSCVLSPVSLYLIPGVAASCLRENSCLSMVGPDTEFYLLLLGDGFCIPLACLYVVLVLTSLGSGVSKPQSPMQLSDQQNSNFGPPLQA